MGRKPEAEGSSSATTRALLLTLLCLLYGQTVALGAPSRPFEHLHADKLGAIAGIVEKAVADGKTPGAVVLVGNSREVVFRKAFGYRALEPEKIPMAEDTIFDLASLTKVVATTTAVMQLSERGELDIEAPVMRYWPAFGKKGKTGITIRQLLTHYSGLRPDLGLTRKWSGYREAMRQIIAEKPVLAPGTGFIYSDINFEILGELVRRVSGLPLDKYCNKNIFRPLGMKDTAFSPPSSLRDRIAPTEYFRGELLCGRPHDPTCYRMGGIAGHAGLFSTADDLSIFARMLLNSGSYGGKKILNKKTVGEMTSAQKPSDKKNLRGFGWALEAPFVPNRKGLFPAGAYGHVGYTGTALWIDPLTDTYIIVLTNRVHPDGKGDVKALRAEIKAAVADALGPPPAEQAPADLQPAEGRPIARSNRTMTGIDMLSARDFLPLKGLRVGLITNNTGLDSEGRRTADLLARAPGVKLAALFCPEHGLSGSEDTYITTTSDYVTGLPVYSLYGGAKRPTDEMLTNLDALVFDIQDAGVRFYTYISTMGYAMEAAAKRGIAFYVLDRPNPLGASLVQGPVMEREFKSFTGYFPMPLRHGMTVGELAEMFNAENRIGADLHVIKMSGYRRTEWFNETGLRWVNPSPNLRSLTEATLYPGVALVEGSNVSVGRGTGSPFELLGSPWINGKKLAAYLNGRNIPGVRFTPAEFVPESSTYKNRKCHGVRITLTDREALDVAFMGVEITEALHKLWPADFNLGKTLGLIGSRRVLQDIRDGQDPRTVARGWQDNLAEFLALRSKYLLY